jgi:hypothetical protein
LNQSQKFLTPVSKLVNSCLPKNEFNKAQEYNDDYALIVISNLDEHPNMNVIFNPVTHINLTPKTITSTQLNYHSDSISWKNLS